MLKSRALLMAAVTLALAACADSNELYIVSRTVVGVNAAVNTAQTAGHLIVGYDRVFLTNPPKSVSPPNGAADQRDAMAVLSCSELTVTGIYLTGFNEHLATGQVATDFAKNIKASPNSSDPFFQCPSSAPQPQKPQASQQ